MWDNESGIGRRGRLADGVAGFWVCWPLAGSDPTPMILNQRARGRANGYLQTSFLPGRTFALTGGLQRTVVDGLAGIANCRTHAVTGLIPADALEAQIERRCSARRWFSQDRFGGHDAGS